MLAAVFEASPLRYSQRTSSDLRVSVVKTLIDAKANLEIKDKVSLDTIETLYYIIMVITYRAHARAVSVTHKTLNNSVFCL